MKQFTRDSTIRLKFTFRDADGNVATPSDAQVSISYCPMGQGEPTVATFPLVQSDDNWVYEWDSSVAAPGVITVHAQSGAGLPISAIDSEFRLKANRANRELTGEF